MDTPIKSVYLWSIPSVKVWEIQVIYVMNLSVKFTGLILGVK